MLTEGDYVIRLIPLPVHVNAVTVFDGDDFANIYINSKLNYEQQKAAIKHEMNHVKRGDANSNLPIQDIERFS